MNERIVDRIGAVRGILWLLLELAAFSLVFRDTPAGGLTSEREIARILTAPPASQA